MRGLRHSRWHVDEMCVKLSGEKVFLWRAVDHEGEILESLVTKTRYKSVALGFQKKAWERHVADRLAKASARAGSVGITSRRSAQPVPGTTRQPYLEPISWMR